MLWLKLQKTILRQLFEVCAIFLLGQLEYDRNRNLYKSKSDVIFQIITGDTVYQNFPCIFLLLFLMR